MLLEVETPGRAARERCLWGPSVQMVGAGVKEQLLRCGKNVPSVEFMYLVFTRMAGESYRRRLGSCCCACVTSFER